MSPEPTAARALDLERAGPGLRAIAGRRASLPEVAERILECAARAPASRAGLVGVSGIDGSGKSHLAPQLAALLEARGARTATVTLDPWHTPQKVRLSRTDGGRVFFERAFRWEELFGRLIEPLVAMRSIDLVIEARRTDNDLTYPKRYAFAAVDVVLLEGIFLLRREHAHRYDLRVWIECSFETALARAHARNQEGLPPEQLERDYREIYFAAQRLHFERDRPRDAADLIVMNDTLHTGVGVTRHG